MNSTQRLIRQNIRPLVKSVVQRVGKLLPVSVYIDVPLRRWPRALGVIHEVAVPRGIKPHPKPRSGDANINIILELLDRAESLPGDIAECGTFQGRTLVSMALYARQHGWEKRIIGFDSFEGFDSSVNVDINLGGFDQFCKIGGFSDTSPELVRSKLKRLQLTNVELAVGFFSQTLPSYAQRQFSFVHLDCDIYGSYKECMEFFYPRLTPGGIILFDEYNDPPWPGCSKAIDEFLQDKPERPQRTVANNYEKYYIVKQGLPLTGARPILRK